MVEWYLLPKDDVSKVIKLKPVYRIIKVVLRSISNANSIFFDMVEKLLSKKNQTHKKIFKTLESFIKEMSVIDILSELLNRLGVTKKINMDTIDSPKKINDIISKNVDIISRDKMWVIVGTLQLIESKLNKISSSERANCISKVLLLGTLRFNSSEYYKLVMRILEELFKDKNSDLILVDSTLIVKIWFNILTLSTDPDLYSTILHFIADVISSAVTSKSKAIGLVHHVLVWYSEINSGKSIEDSFKNTIFEGIYDNNQELFSTHYCQSIDLFLGTFRSDAEDQESNKLVSEIFNNIMSALNKPSKSASFAKIWNELFKCLAIIGSNEENVNKFVSTFLSLPSDIQDNLYSHFDIDNINLDSSKSSSSKKFSVSVVFKLLRSFFKYGLNEKVSEKDQLRVYTICDDLICKLATNEP